jgi:hypothetical protein
MKIKPFNVSSNNFKLFLMIGMLLPFCNYGQNYTLIGDRSFGTISSETTPIISKLDNKIIVAGTSSYTGINGDKTDASCSSNPSDADVWMLMLDQNLNIIWNKAIGGLDQDEIHGLVVGLNNSITLSGRLKSDSSCDISTFTRGNYDLWFCMLDSNGYKLLDSRYGSSSLEEGGKLVRNSDGDYLIFGGSNGGISGDKTTPGYGNRDFWLIRTDSLGNKIWDRTYGGNDIELTNQSSGYFISSIKNNQYLIGGRSTSWISGTISTNGYGYHDAWLAKLDSVGNVIWDKRFGGSDVEHASKMIELNDGYLLLGTSISKTGGTILDTGIAENDVWLVKMDTIGNQLWEKRYGGIDDDMGIDIQEAPDGGFWVLGQTNGPASYDVSEASYGGNDYWIFKIDSMGNKLWDKRFGGPGNDFASSLVIMPDSSIFICGHAEAGISSVKTDSGNGLNDYWIVHFNYYNNTTGINSTNASHGITISPNPTQNILNVKGLLMGQYEAILFGVDGRVIKQSLLQGGNEVNYSLDDVSPGMYLLRFNGDKFTATIKVVKE